MSLLLLAVLSLVPHKLTLADGRRITLSVPRGYDVHVAAEGLRRVRFMALAPDGRLFVTDLYNRTDNTRGKVYVLDGFDRKTKRFAKVTPYLEKLRNPNSIAFHTDPAGTHWLYVALTDKLVRYRYEPGSVKPRGEPEVIATFPAYGLDYKYGGWHLTRTVAIGPNGKVYVSVGSSCNACDEKEDVRATVLEMNADGSGQRRFVTGLRNAVGLAFDGPTLYATNMGADHLGDDVPADTLYALIDGADYGWPQCYEARGRILEDPLHASKAKPCSRVPKALAAFPAHASPLGLTRVDGGFLVALHGSSKKKLRHGYRVARVRDGKVEDFMTGFLAGGKVVGRPADVLRLEDETLLVTDDYAGVIYAVSYSFASSSSR